MLTRLDNAFSTQKQFSANAAHELRTPLAVLQTNLEVFEKKQEPEMVEYQQLFTMIKEQTARLSQLVGTLLDMTNLKSVPRTDHVSLEELVDEVFCDLDPVAEKAGISIPVSYTHLFTYKTYIKLIPMIMAKHSSYLLHPLAMACTGHACLHLSLIHISFSRIDCFSCS